MNYSTWLLLLNIQNPRFAYASSLAHVCTQKRKRKKKGELLLLESLELLN